MGDTPLLFDLRARGGDTSRRLSGAPVEREQRQTMFSVQHKSSISLGYTTHFVRSSSGTTVLDISRRAPLDAPGTRRMRSAGRSGRRLPHQPISERLNANAADIRLPRPPCVRSTPQEKTENPNKVLDYHRGDKNRKAQLLQQRAFHEISIRQNRRLRRPVRMIIRSVPARAARAQDKNHPSRYGVDRVTVSGSTGGGAR